MCVIAGINATPRPDYINEEYEYELRKEREIDHERWQWARVKELAAKMAEDCPWVWRWGDGDGGSIINAVVDAFESAGIRDTPMEYTRRECSGSENDDGGQTLYRFYDRGGRLLYVGITDNPFRRWEQHSKDKPWFGEVHRFEREWYPTRDSVIAAERHAIRNESPLYNVVHNNSLAMKWEES